MIFADAVETAAIQGWLGPVLTLIGVLIVTATGLITRRLRGAVEVRDLWKENRDLRAELIAQDARINATNDAIDELRKQLLQERTTQQQYNRVFADGFDALSRVNERIVSETGVRPTYAFGEHEAIERARALRSVIDNKPEPKE